MPTVILEAMIRNGRAAGATHTNSGMRPTMLGSLGLAMPDADSLKEFEQLSGYLGPQ